MNPSVGIVAVVLLASLFNVDAKAKKDKIGVKTYVTKEWAEPVFEDKHPKPSKHEPAVVYLEKSKGGHHHEYPEAPVMAHPPPPPQHYHHYVEPMSKGKEMHKEQMYYTPAHVHPPAAAKYSKDYAHPPQSYSKSYSKPAPYRPSKESYSTTYVPVTTYTKHQSYMEVSKPVQKYVPVYCGKQCKLRSLAAIGQKSSPQTF